MQPFHARGAVFPALVATVFILVSPAYSADKLTLKDGTSVSGTFEKFNAGCIHMKTADGQAFKESLAKIESLAMDPVTTVNAKPRAKKRMENVKFKGYQKPKFIFEEGGKEVLVSGSEMSMIEIGLDFARAMQIASTAPADEAPAVNMNIEEQIKPGSITVVHFFCPELRPLQQPDNYIVRLSEEKKIELVQVNIGAWDSPAAQKHGIKSLPQFWFYDKAGKSFTNLVDRFTLTDIDNTIKAAKRR